MRADTQSISIDAAQRRIVEFLQDPQNLPRWAVGFAKAVWRDGDRWMVKTGSGEMEVRIDSEPTSGIVDFWLTLAPGVKALAASRVVPRGQHAEYVFTQFQAPGMPDEAFAMNVRTIAHELSVLKALMEVECPL